VGRRIGTVPLAIHGDHLFYDGLENPDAVVRGVAIAEADADADGTVTLDELDAVHVAGLGYEVGQYSDVTTLGEFVTFLTRTLGQPRGRRRPLPGEPVSYWPVPSPCAL
jgi:hypothetical protein